MGCDIIKAASVTSRTCSWISEHVQVDILLSTWFSFSYNLSTDQIHHFELLFCKRWIHLYNLDVYKYRKLQKCFKLAVIFSNTTVACITFSGIYAIIGEETNITTNFKRPLFFLVFCCWESKIKRVPFRQSSHCYYITTKLSLQLWIHEWNHQRICSHATTSLTYVWTHERIIHTGIINSLTDCRTWHSAFPSPPL